MIVNHFEVNGEKFTGWDDAIATAFIQSEAEGAVSLCFVGETASMSFLKVDGREALCFHGNLKSNQVHEHFLTGSNKLASITDQDVLQALTNFNGAPLLVGTKKFHNVYLWQENGKFHLATSH
jgi:hypothetical protein